MAEEPGGGIMRAGGGIMRALWAAQARAGQKPM